MFASKIEYAHQALAFSPTVVKSGNFLSWTNSLIHNWVLHRNTLDLQVPWISYAATAWFENYLDSNMKVFEYGSGGSTIFYALRVNSVVAVEHDLGWYELVTKTLKNKGLNNVKVLLKLPEPTSLKGNYECDNSFLSTFLKGYSFKGYAESILAFPDDFFDLVSVDGVARPSCIKLAKNKVKSGGCLMVDDAERNHYQKAFKLLSGWRKIMFKGPAPTKIVNSQTNIWQKP